MIMNEQTIITFLISSGLLVALLAFALSGLKYLKVYLDAKTADLLANNRSVVIKAAVTKAEDSIWAVVFQLAQETVDNIKEKALDGKLTADEITILRDTAYTRAITLMGDKAYSLLYSYTDDVKTWIYTKIDAISRETKL